jgi:hypothetical protein
LRQILSGNFTAGEPASCNSSPSELSLSYIRRREETAMPTIARKTTLWTLFIGAAVLMLGADSSAPIQKKPVPRRDAFFGLHFDLHSSETDVALGADISEENIGNDRLP